MAIQGLFWSKKTNNSQKRVSSDRYLFLTTLFSVYLVASCSQSQLSQCEQIFRIVSEVNIKSRTIKYNDRNEASQLKRWLEAARLMNRAADKIQALHINSGELIQYQNQLANIYRIYSQATYDAVAARENKNLSGLESARDSALKAGEMQNELIEKVNDYCSQQ